MKDFFKKEIYLTTTVALFAAFLLFASLFFMYSTYKEKSKISKVNSDISELKAELQQLEKGRLSPKIKQSIKSLYTFFIDKTSVLEFVSTLEDHAKSLGLKTSGFLVSSSSEDEGLLTYSVAFTIKGDINKILQYIEEINRLGKTLYLDNLKLSFDEQDEKWSLSASLVFNALDYEKIK